jgi:phage tail-like protein
VRRQAIERLLPAMYQRAATPGSVLFALLDVMEGLHAPTETTLAAVDDLVAPYRTPDPLVPFLLGWVGLDHIATAADPRSAGAIPVGRLRSLLARSAELAQWRGTAFGLRAMLETVTGVAGFAVDEPAGQPFHFVVRVPHPALDQMDLVRRVLAAEKPAATTCEVVSAGEE